MNARSLKFRLVAWYAGWATLLFVVFGVFVYASLSHYLREALREALARRARQVAEAVQRTPRGFAGLSAMLEATFASEANNRFTRVTINGVLIHVSGKPADGSFDPAIVPPASKRADREVFELRDVPDRDDLFVVTLRRETNGEHIVVEEGASAASLRNTLHAWLVVLLSGLLVLIAGTALGGFVLVQRALAPVDAIIGAASRISLENRNDRLPVAPTGDELERLSASLNGMISRLDDSFQQTRRFLADASHELRTPLTIIHAELEQLASSADDPGVSRAAGSALEETQRLRKIVEALFTLSRFDAGEALQEALPVDVAQLATATAEQMQLLAEDKSVVVRCDCEANTIVRGDPARLKQVIVNLLDNAIKYTPDGGQITITVRRSQDRAELIVADTGMGIPAAALPHVFDRFFRVDKARSRDEGGAGLGLSIVKAICAAHGGTVSATSQEGTGARFIVDLPLEGARLRSRAA